ncbi:MAG: lysylphosphatidylglycerol synthase domain-containing protein [Anaerolineae bacterium]
MGEKKTFVNRLRSLAKRMFAVLAIGFIAYSVYGGWSDIQGFDWTIRWPFLLFAVILYALFFMLRGVVWGMAVRMVDDRLPLDVAVRGYTLAYLSRYVPGAIWPFMTITAIAQDYNLSKRLLIAVFLLNIILLVLVDSLYLLPYLLGWLGVSAMLLGALFFCILLLGLPTMIRLCLPYAQSLNLLSNENKFDPIMQPQNFYRLVLMTMLHQAIQLGAYFSFIAGMIDLDATIIAYLSLAYAVAWLIGLLAIIVPQGLGVREYSFVLLATTFITGPIAVTLSIALRLLTISGEVLALILHVCLQRYGILSRVLRTTT